MALLRTQQSRCSARPAQGPHRLRPRSRRRDRDRRRSSSLVLLRLHEGQPVHARLPFKAVFPSANSLKPKSPVRIAGVNVGHGRQGRGPGGHQQRGRDDGGQGGGPADPQGRDAQGPPAHLARGQLLRRRRARHAVDADDLRRRHDPGRADAATRCRSTSSSPRCSATRARTCRRRSRSSARRSRTSRRPSRTPTSRRTTKGKTAAQALNSALGHGEDALRDSAIVQNALLGEEQDDLTGLVARPGADRRGARPQGAPGRGAASRTSTRRWRAFASESGEPAARRRRARADGRRRAYDGLGELNDSLPACASSRRR